MVSCEVKLSSSLFVCQNDDHPQLHSRKLDKILGYKVSKIESKLLQKYRSYDQSNDDSNKKQHYKGTQTWIGLHPQALQTPYSEIYQVLNVLKDSNIEHVVDIGAGYGRVGIVLSVIFPKANFTGFEIVKKRQLEGNRIFKKHGALNSRIELSNVLDLNFKIPDADIYFIYDFSDLDDVNQILNELRQKAINKTFFLITRGERVDYLMKNKFNNTWITCFENKTSDLKIYTSINVL